MRCWDDDQQRTFVTLNKFWVKTPPPCSSLILSSWIGYQLIYISFYISRYHFSQLFRTWFSITWFSWQIFLFKQIHSFLLMLLLSQSPYLLLNKNINFDKNKKESKMENPTQIFTAAIAGHMKLLGHQKLDNVIVM